MGQSGTGSKAWRNRGERGTRQRRYWEHLAREEVDLRADMADGHRNPVKHRLVEREREWPHSTFHRAVRASVYRLGWAGGNETVVECLD